MAREKDPHTGRDHAERTALMRRRNAASPRSGATRMRTSPTTISTSGTGAPGGTSSFCLFRKALRQPNSCGGEIPRRRASAETLMPGSSAAVTACALYFRPTAPLADRRTVQPLNERLDQLQATSRRHRRRTGRRHGTSAIRATPEAYPRPDMPLTHGVLFPLTDLELAAELPSRHIHSPVPWSRSYLRVHGTGSRPSGESRGYAALIASTSAFQCHRSSSCTRETVMFGGRASTSAIHAWGW